MKSKKDIRKPVKNGSYDSDELKRARKLEPVKKEKNVRRSLYEEIDDDELDDELSDSFIDDEFIDDDAYDDEDDD